jgi:hypothetical protein
MGDAGMTTLEYKFTYDLKIGDAILHQLVGVAFLEPDTDGPRSADHADWYVERLELDAVRPKAGIAPADTRGAHEHCRVEVPDDHPLHDQILVWLINTNRHDIDVAWADRMRGKIASARQRFSIPARQRPTLVPVRP